MAKAHSVLEVACGRNVEMIPAAWCANLSSRSFSGRNDSVAKAAEIHYPPKSIHARPPAAPAPFLPGGGRF